MPKTGLAAPRYGWCGWLLFGLIFFAAAAGDIWMTWLMLKEPKDALFLDHPSEAGFYVMEKGPEEEK